MARTLSITLRGTKADGTASAIVLAVSLLSAITRTLGLTGDGLELVARKADWAPADWDLARPMKLTFGFVGSGGDPDELITLGGYILKSVTPTTKGVPLPVGVGVDGVGGAGASSFRCVQLSLVTLPGLWRDGRGGRITSTTAGTLNPVDSDGRVIASGAAYKTNSQLITLLVAACGTTLGGVAGTVDGFEPPGPLDWGNASAVAELETLLARIGHAASFSNLGTRIDVVKLPVAGETLVLPDQSPGGDPVESYELSTAPAIRGRTIVVTSGRTRRVILRRWNLDKFEWVWFDEKQAKWLNDTETNATYAGTIKPGDIAKWRLGPPKDVDGRQQFSRLFSALRIKDSTDRAKSGRLVALNPTVLDGQPYKATKVAAVVEAQVAVPAGPSQFRNDPDSGSGLKRLLGARVHPLDAVIDLPSGVAYVRMNSGGQGNYGDSAALTTNQVQVTFAHESNEADFIKDYYVRAWRATITSGALVMTALTGTDLTDAVADPLSIKLEAPHLVAVSDGLGGGAPTPLNDTALDAMALGLAKARAAGDLAQSGVIEWRGLYDWEPGDWTGAVSAVSWDIANGRTLLSINEHDVPQSFLDAQEESARRSFAAGVNRFVTPGASAALSDVKAGSTPGMPMSFGALGLNGALLNPLLASGSRGAENVAADRSGSAPPSPPAMPRLGPAQEWLARITASASVGTNKWEYEWEEVYSSDTAGVFTTGANPRTHTTHGKARNTFETPNSGSGIQGNGVDVANLGGMTIQPIAVGAVVLMRGAFGTSVAPYCVFSAVNATDGACE